MTYSLTVDGAKEYLKRRIELMTPGLPYTQDEIEMHKCILNILHKYAIIQNLAKEGEAND